MVIAVKHKSVTTDFLYKDDFRNSLHIINFLRRDRVKVGQQPFCSVCDGHIIGRLDMRKIDI
jgi:hypothetical protein